MDDSRIVDLYWERSEQAICETERKYGNYCFSIANNILPYREDAEESVNDTYLAAWNVIPPQKPTLLGAFLGRITRNLSLKKLRSNTAAKRGGNEAILSLEELSDCIPAGKSFDEALQAQELADIISNFLRSLSKTEQKIFVVRYWYCASIQEIAVDFGFTQSKVKMMLLRTRTQLREHLIKEGIL